ncbi:MAG: ABC transporter substrate-binding protein [Bacteroidetes bacterium]|nr:ABC transporter substrate-binding protein [Bacteroidota bacterium]
MFEYTDQIGNKVKLKEKPMRIISIVPSQSEFLWDLGLKNELVGITKFCVHPNQMFTSVERVGGTKKINIEKIRKLKPDLIIGNKEENEKSDIEALQKEFKVWMSDIYNFEDAFIMMMELGKMTGKEKEAERIVNKIKKDLPKVKDIFNGERVAYFIWYKPYMFAAKDTFIDHVLNYIGLKNALGNLKRYPELTDEEIKKIDLKLCFLSSEPFPFKVKHVKELKDKLPLAKITIVDGEIFSWYGSRLQHFKDYVLNLKESL